VVETTCRAQGLVLAQVLDAQLRPGGGDGVDEGLEDGLLIVSDDEDLLDLGDGCYSAEAVFDDGVAGDGEQRLAGLAVGTTREEIQGTHLGQLHRQRPEPCTAGRPSDL
jgi:hypothetical protein